MRTTIRLSDRPLRKAKQQSTENNTTLTPLIEEGPKAMHAEPGQKPARKPAQRLRLPVSKASGGTLPGVDLNRSIDLENLTSKV